MEAGACTISRKETFETGSVYHHSHVVEHESVFVCHLLDHLARIDRTMTRLCLDPDQDRIIAAVPGLQFRNELERMSRFLDNWGF